MLCAAYFMGVKDVAIVMIFQKCTNEVYNCPVDILLWLKLVLYSMCPWNDTKPQVTIDQW